MFVALFNAFLVKSFVSGIHTLVNQDLFVMDISSNHGSKAQHGMLINGFSRWGSGVIFRQDGFLKQNSFNLLISLKYKTFHDRFSY